MAAKLKDAELVQKLEALLPRIYEFSELLIDKLGVVDVGAYYPHTVTLHPSCHSLRSLQAVSLIVSLFAPAQIQSRWSFTKQVSNARHSAL